MKQENWIMLGIMFALFVNAFALIFNNVHGATFVCSDKIIAREMTPTNIQDMFETCINRCKSGDNACYTNCSDMIEKIVSTTQTTDSAES